MEDDQEHDTKGPDIHQQLPTEDTGSLLTRDHQQQGPVAEDWIAGSSRGVKLT